MAHEAGQMKPEQMTQDEFNNWFPHVSPDGRRIVFLSFMKDVPAEKHPYYERVICAKCPRLAASRESLLIFTAGRGPLMSPPGIRTAVIWPL